MPPLLIEEEWLRLVEEVEQAACETGKRIAELCTALLGVLFAVLALGGTFPPPLLAALPRARSLAVGRVGSALPGSARRYLGHPPAQLPALSPQPHPNAARTGTHGRFQSALGGGGRRALCTGLSGAGRPGGDGNLGSVAPRRSCFGVYYERDGAGHRRILPTRTRALTCARCVGPKTAPWPVSAIWRYRPGPAPAKRTSPPTSGKWPGVMARTTGSIL